MFGVFFDLLEELIPFFSGLVQIPVQFLLHFVECKVYSLFDFTPLLFERILCCREMQLFKLGNISLGFLFQSGLHAERIDIEIEMFEMINN